MFHHEKQNQQASVPILSKRAIAVLEATLINVRNIVDEYAEEGNENYNAYVCDAIRDAASIEQQVGGFLNNAHDEAKGWLYHLGMCVGGGWFDADDVTSNRYKVKGTGETKDENANRITVLEAAIFMAGLNRRNHVSHWQRREIDEAAEVLKVAEPVEPVVHEDAPLGVGVCEKGDTDDFWEPGFRNINSNWVTGCDCARCEANRELSPNR